MKRLAIALANAARKARLRERNEDKVEGDHLSTKPPKVVRAVLGNFNKKVSMDKVRNVPNLDVEGAKVKEIVSLSNDVIFNPATQTTRYSASRAAKTNLERRMPGYSVDVVYGSGEGMLRFYAKTTQVVPINGIDTEVFINAECIASPTDMALHLVEITANEKMFKIDPPTTALFPEEAVNVLRRIAENCTKTM